MDTFIAVPAVVLFAAGLLMQQRAQRHRTRESLERERQARGQLSWYFTRYFYSALDFEPSGRRTFRVGQALHFSAVLWAVLASIFVAPA